MNIENKVVLVTGGSSGIGEAIARRLADSGAKVMLTARREDRLKTITDEIVKKGGQAAYKAGDVTNPDALKAVVAEAEEKFGPVDVLVNNAGLMPLSPVSALKTDEWNTMVDVNIKGVLNGIAAVMPGMKDRGKGHIINVSSVAGHLVFPGSAVYSATKFAVRALSEGLRQENPGTLRVTNVSPGAVATELPSTITDEEAKKMIDYITDIAIDADAIARGVAYAIGEPDDVSVNELIIRPTRQEL
ncbi:SDR family oxidoreductase [Euryhalocaulis caribicus]|uniref:SDR family oxidoreductase n=1 Tax=Euryhalocaulis caribicus TaxID=1161401 RepID=UPI0003A8B26A|nr:SDR family oxidoreductase [Euryhalocaulis caribicus]